MGFVNVLERGGTNPVKSRWDEAVEEFLAAIHPRQRVAVEQMLKRPNCGGQSLRNWLRAIVSQNRKVHSKFPRELIEVYLRDSEAEPVHDCSRCGLMVPVHVDRHHDPDGETGRSYFP